MPAPSGARIGQRSADLVVTNHGSLVLVEPKNDLARTWLLENISGESTWWGTSLVVEPRYVGALVDGARREGWTVEWPE